jgi:hypothetical protein
MYPFEKIKVGTWFIDLDKDYDEVKLIMTGHNPKNDNKLSVMWYNFPSEPTIIEKSEFKGTPFPDLNGRWTEIQDRFLELKDIYAKSLKPITQIIFNTAFKKISIPEAIEFYTKNKLVNEDEANAFLKLSIAKGFLSFERQKGGDFVKLSQLILEFENKKRFLQAIADEIISKSERIELLIQHNTTKGNYREELLRGILRKYLPKKYEIATGFIEGCERQCDILIYDSQNFSPLFREGDLVVLPEKAVRAVIEVKSTMDSNQLSEALDLLAEVARHRNTPAPIFKGIFAFKKDMVKEKTIADSIAEFYHSNDSSGVITKDILFLFETINSICVLNEQCLVSDLFDYKLEDNTIRPRLYSVHSENDDLKPFCAAFFNELFSFLDVDKHAKKVNINYFKSLDNEIKYKMELELYEKDWKPSSSFHNEHKFDFDSIWSRTSDVINWKVGNYTIQDLEEKYFSDFFSPKDFKQKFQFKSE